MLIPNHDWVNWKGAMAVDRVAAGELRRVGITVPRPGHADLAGALKYGQTDLRNILERASARETASRTAAGAVAMAFLERLGVRAACHVLEIGGIRLGGGLVPFSRIARQAGKSPVRCVDAVVGRRMMGRIDEARAEGDTVGGCFELRIKGVVPGIGSHVHWDRKLDGRLSQAVMSIPSVKAVEFGLGVEYARRPGSRAHDPISFSRGAYRRASNHCGGIEGGVSNGEEIILRGTVKPIPTMARPLASVDMASKKAVLAGYERSDVCAVPAASVVGLAACAFEIAGMYLEKFGGDFIEETLRNAAAYLRYLKAR
jgi:chorismate synthase